MQEVRAAIDRLAEGDYSVRVKPFDSSDRLVKSFGKLVDSLDKITGVAGELDKGALGVRFDVKGKDDLFARRMNSLISSLNKQGDFIKSLAEGDYSGSLKSRGDTDVVGGLLQQLASSLQDNAKIVAEIEKGNIQVAAKVKGSKDYMAGSINKIVARFSDINGILLVLAQGNYEVDVQLLSERDVLGSNLKLLAKSLCDVTEFTNLLSVGNVSVDIDAKGSDDRLIQNLKQVVVNMQNVRDCILRLSEGSYYIEPIKIGDSDELGGALIRLVGSVQSAANAVTLIGEGNIGLRYEPASSKDIWDRIVGDLLGKLSGLNEHMICVAKGDFSGKLAVDNEDDVLSMSANNMSQMLRDTTKQVVRIAEGGLSFTSQTSGGSDELSVALASIVQTLQHLAKNADDIAAGNYDVAMQARSSDDVVAAGFNKMYESLVRKSQLIQSVAKGRLVLQEEELNIEDVVVSSIVQIVEKFSEITNFAKEISVGDFTKSIDVRNSDDVLSKSLNDAVGFLRDVQNTAKLLAAGNIHVQGKVRGKNDHLSTAINNIGSTLTTMDKCVSSVKKGDYGSGELSKIGDSKLGRNIQELVAILDKKSKFTKGLSIGQLDGEIFVQSEKDVLAKSLQSIQKLLLNIVAQVDILSFGSNRSIIKKLSKNDEVAESFAKLVDYLQNIEDISTTLSDRNLAKVKVAGDSGKTLRNLHNISSSFAMITEFAGRVAKGDYSGEVAISNESDVVAAALSDALKDLWRKQKMVRDLSLGKVDLEAVPSGKKDDVTHAVNKIAANFKLVDSIVQSVARGDYNIEVEVAGDTDNLGKSIHSMIQSLQDVTQASSLIAGGSIDTSVKVKSENDALAQNLNSISKAMQDAKSVFIDIASGRYDIDASPKAYSDQLGTASSLAVSSLQDLAGTVLQLAGGKVNLKASVKSKDDLLALSINAVIANLSEYIKHMQSMAKGDYHMPAKPKNKSDEVAWALYDVSKSFNDTAKTIEKIASGQWGERVVVKSAKDFMAKNLNRLASEVEESLSAVAEARRDLQNRSDDLDRQSWVTNNLKSVEQLLQPISDLGQLVKEFLKSSARIVDAHIAGVYIVRQGSKGKFLSLEYGFGFALDEDNPKRVNYGQGLIGQCAVDMEKASIDDLPDDYFAVGSSIGGMNPKSLIVLPISFKGNLLAVLEVAAVRGFNQASLDFLQGSAQILASNMDHIMFETQLSQKTTQGVKKDARLDELGSINAGLNRDIKAVRSQLQQHEELLKKARDSMRETNKVSGNIVKFNQRMTARYIVPLEQAMASLEDMREIIGKKNYAKLHEKYAYIHAMVNQTVDLYKLHNNDLEVNVEPLATTDYILGVYNQFSDEAKAKNIIYDIEFSAGFARTIYTDKFRLSQVVSILLDNAIKHTDSGWVKLKIYTSSDADKVTGRLKPGEVILGINITDSGSGISPSDQEGIFDLYRSNHLGLDLPFAYELVKSLGGTMELSSEKGKGTSIDVYLPSEFTSIDNKKPAKQSFESVRDESLELVN